MNDVKEAKDRLLATLRASALRTQMYAVLKITSKEFSVPGSDTKFSAYVKGPFRTEEEAIADIETSETAAFGVECMVIPLVLIR